MNTVFEIELPHSQVFCAFSRYRPVVGQEGWLQQVYHKLIIVKILKFEGIDTVQLSPLPNWGGEGGA